MHLDIRHYSVIGAVLFHLTGVCFEDTKIGRHCRWLLSRSPRSGNNHCSDKITGGLEERLPPRTLPYVVGIIILISGALLAIRSWRFHGEDPVIKWPDRRGTIRVSSPLLVWHSILPYGTPGASLEHVSVCLLHRLVPGEISPLVSFADRVPIRSDLLSGLHLSA